jgi:hypothetical protein
VRIRFRLGILAAAVAAASILAGGSLARPYVDRGDLARSSSSNVAGSQGRGAAGNQGQASAGDPSSPVDPAASAKKGKGYCGEESDGDVSKCPAAPKKSAKKGKGYAGE